MKALISILSALVVTSSFAHATVGSKNINGTWSLVNRVCTDNQSPNDAFQLNRDELELTINGKAMQVTMVIENEDYSSSNTFKKTEKVMTITSEAGVSETVGYKISDADELTLVSSGFGPGGTCNEDQSLLSIFKRK